MTGTRMPSVVRQSEVARIDITATHPERQAPNGPVVVTATVYDGADPLIQVDLSGASGWVDVEALTPVETEQLRDALTRALEHLNGPQA